MFSDVSRKLVCFCYYAIGYQLLVTFLNKLLTAEVMKPVQ